MHYLSIERLLHCMATLLILQASGRVKCCTTVHGPAQDRGATVKQLFLEAITQPEASRLP